MLCLGQLLKTDCNLSKYQPDIPVQLRETSVMGESVSLVCMPVISFGLFYGSARVLQKILYGYFYFLRFRAFDTYIFLKHL